MQKQKGLAKGSLTRGHPSNLAVVPKGRWSVFRSSRAPVILFPFERLPRHISPPLTSHSFLLILVLYFCCPLWLATHDVPDVRQRHDSLRLWEDSRLFVVVVLQWISFPNPEFRLHRGYMSWFWRRLMLQVKITFRLTFFSTSFVSQPWLFMNWG